MLTFVFSFEFSDRQASPPNKDSNVFYTDLIDAGPQSDHHTEEEEEEDGDEEPLTSTSPAASFQYLIFGQERSEPETRDVIKYTDKPRHLLVRWAFNQSILIVDHPRSHY